MGISRDKFKGSITNFYTKDGIYSLYKEYFIDWIADGHIGLHLDIFEVSLLSETSNKSVFVDLLEEAFYKKETFVEIFNSLEEEVKDIFRSIIWSGKYILEESQIEELFEKEHTYETSENLKDKYKFFHYKKNKIAKEGPGYLYLDNDIIRKIRPHCPNKVRDYFIHPIENPIYTYKHNSEEEICKKYSLYYNFYSQGNIKLSTSLKLLKESKRDMQKYCDISEFYSENKDLDYLKTETMGLLFYLIKDEYLVPENFKLDKFKYIVNEFLNGKLTKNDGYEYTTKYLNYLKGVKNIKKTENLTRSLQTIVKLIMELPSEKTISISNIINYLVYRDEFLDIIELKDVYDYVYINESNYGRTRISQYDEYHRYIIEPFVKSIFFLLGSLGLFTLYYDLPSGNNGLYLKNNYLSKYDGLKYIELTKLGEYVLGRADDYAFTEENEDAEIVYDEDLLLITIIGSAPIMSMFLEKVSIKIGENKYRMDKGRFLKGITTTKELEERIKEFKNKFYKDLPQVWETFFDELRSKVNCLTHESDIKVFKVKQDKEFFKILATESKLKEYILKAEGFYILIKEENVCKVKTILSKYGYFNEIE
ncbi:hypothetical protein [Psychrilyobacter atlanticus]|uniref:hypothetical protein n=1 Tax=Psychrilyobacter atlanticus TaxID=271091 RepID=UPI00041AFDEB|nr:hypothetical protein [Psychrilyobacter atlanticus]